MNEELDRLRTRINEIFESECADYANRSADLIEKMWAIEQRLRGLSDALNDMHRKYAYSAVICNGCGGIYWDKVTQCDCDGVHTWSHATVMKCQ